MAVYITTARAGGLAACLAVSLGATATFAAPEPPDQGANQVYDLAYFQQYDLSNAEDMVRRIPGGAGVLDSSSSSQARGLGAGTEQILIDGKRLASKSTSAAASLRRIPASSVARIELIRGSTDEVRSEGIVINVVIKQGLAAGGVGNFEVGYRFDDDGWSDADGLVSWSDSIGRLSYVLAYENANWSPVGSSANGGDNDWSRRFRDERFFYPSGAPQELRPQRWRREFERNTFTGNAAYDFTNGDTLHFNALFQTNPVKQVDVTDQSRFSSTGLLTGRSIEDRYSKSSNDNFELGGDLEKALGAAKLKVIALHTRSQTEQSDFRNRTESTGELFELGRSGSDQHKGEDVVQASIVFPLGRKQTVTMGVEGARNTLTQQIDFFFDLDRNGRLEQIDVPTAFAQVMEKRAETFVTHNWRIGSKVTVDSALYFEISRITTNYPEIPVRVLRAFKPRIDVEYAVTSSDRLRFTLEKTVGQLNFSSFVPTYNVVDNRVDLGNPTIKPARFNTAAVQLEHRLPSDGGTLKARIFYRELLDVGNGFVPFGVNAAGLPQSRRGSIPKTTHLGIELDGAVRLTPLGLPGAQLTTAFARSRTRSLDLFNLRMRKGLSTWDQELAIGFRHDLRAWRASYGVDYYALGGEQLVSDVRQWETFTRGPRVNAFVEKSLWGSISVRFDVYNLNGARDYRDRTLYIVSQLNGAINRTESFVEKRDRRFALHLRGKI